MSPGRRSKTELIGELISEFRAAGNQDSAFDNLAAERLGLNRTDRRRVKLEVTPKFYARADRIWGPVAKDWATRLGGRFTADELERLIDFLRTTNELSREHIERL